MASTRSTIDLVIRGSLSGLTGAVGAAKAELDALRQRAETLAPAGERAGRALLVLSKAMLAISAASGTIHLIAGATIALGQLAGSAVLIPAALAGLGAVFATVKIGLSGFGDAVKKGGEDLAKLSPQARATAQALRDMAPEFKKVKDAVQDSLFKGLSTEVAALGSKYLPLLKTGLSGIATPLNGLVTGFVRVAKSGQSVKDVTTVLDGTKTALTGIEPAAGAVLAGFLRLASAGIKSFAGLGKGITDLAVKFRDWANALVISGRFDILVARAKVAFGQIVSIVSNVGATIASIFRGLSTGGGSPLAALDALTTKLREFFATASAQDALKSLGEAFRTVADVTRTVLLEALKQLAPIVRDLAPFVAECARVFGTLLVNALKIVGPILQSVAKFLGEHKELAQVLIPLIAGLALKFALLRVGAAVVAGIASLSTKLGGLVGILKLGGLVALAAAAVELDKLNVAAAPNGDTEQSGGLADTLHNIVEAGKQLASGDFSGIMAKIRDEVNQTSATWTAGQAPIQQWIDKVKTSFSNDLLAPMEAFGARVNEIIDKIVKSFSTDLLTPLTDFGSFINGVIDGVIAKMNEFGAFVNGVIAGVIQAMTDFGTNVNGVIQAVIDKMNEFGTFVNGIIAGVIAAMQQFGAGVNAAIQTVIDKMNEFGAFVNGIIAQVISAMTNFGAGVNAAIDAAIQAFVRFVTEVANNINQAIAFIGTLPGRAAAALASLGALIVGVANQAWTAFLGAVRSGTDAVIGFVRGIPGMISGAIGNLGSILINAGRSLMDGLLSGIRAGLTAVLDFARGIAAQIAAVKGPIPKDRKTLVPAGLALMHGLLDGLKTGNRDVQAFVGTIADQIAQSASRGGLIATAGKFTAETGGTGGTGAGGGPGITSTSAPLPVTIPIHIGDEVVRVVRTEIDTSNRDVRRTVRAGAGVTAG
jgi:phage-related protein